LVIKKKKNRRKLLPSSSGLIYLGCHYIGYVRSIFKHALPLHNVWQACYCRSVRRTASFHRARCLDMQT